jgi:nitrogen-specific signal transduction histidine kinase
LNDVVDNLGEALEAKDQREEELRETMAKLQQAQKMETVGNLTGGIAHDFNNLLGVLIGNLDLLKEIVAEDGEATELVEEALEAGLRGKELNRRMLAFARRQSLKPEILDVNEILTSMTKLLQRSLGERIEINLRCSANAWPIKVDPSQFETAILNLAINARDAMPNGGHLVLETSNVKLDESYVEQDSELEPGDYVMLAVTDAGTGIPKEILRHVFDPFFTTKEVGAGTGLGLALCHRVVSALGGRISVEDNPGGGAVFALRLPAASQRAPRPAAPAHAPGTLAPARVLLVEDEAEVAGMIAEILRRAGFEVTHAASGEEALRLAENGEFNVILSDLAMPGIGGRGFYEALARDHPAAARRVAFVTGDTMSPAARNFLDGTGRPRLEKPIAPDDLRTLMARMLQEGPQ